MALVGRPDSAGRAVCGRELKMEVRRSRGEGRAGLEDGFGMMHEVYMLARHKDGRVKICQPVFMH